MSLCSMQHLLHSVVTTHCIVPHQLWRDIPCIWTRPSTLRWSYLYIYVAWHSEMYNNISHISHHLLPSFFASVQYLLPSELIYLWAASSAHFHNISHHLHASWTQPIPPAPITVEGRCGMWW